MLEAEIFFFSDHHKELIKSFQTTCETQSFPKCHSHPPLPLNRITAENKSDEERVGRKPDAKCSERVKTRHGVVFGLVALLAVPLNPVRCVFMLGLTQRSGERCDSLSGFRHIVAAK